MSEHEVCLNDNDNRHIKIALHVKKNYHLLLKHITILDGIIDNI